MKQEKQGCSPFREQKDSFCFYPFFQVLMTAEGKFKPCSKHGEFIVDSEGTPLRVGETTIEEAYNSEYMIKLRESFHTKTRMKGCHECWREQDMGLRPMRLDSFDYPIP